MKRRPLGGLILAVVAVVLTLGALELGVRLLVPQDLDYFNSTKLRRPSTRPGWTWELVPGARSESYVGVPVTINALGLRDDEIAVPKPRGTVRILAVGDSVTFGYGVRLEETFVKQLQRRLNAAAGPGIRYEVVNAGVEATGLDQYYQFLASQGRELEPDLVIVDLALNDIYPYAEGGATTPSRPSPVARAVRAVNGGLLSHSQLYLLSYMRVKSLLYRTGVLDINRVHDYDFLPLEPPSERQARAWRMTYAWLGRIVALTRERGWPLALVVFPEEVQLGPASLALYHREFGTTLGPEVLDGEPQRRIVEFGRAHEVPVIDLLPAFRRAGDEPLYLRNRAISFDPVHPSPHGHRVAAAALSEALGPALVRGGPPAAPSARVSTLNGTP